MDCNCKYTPLSPTSKDEPFRGVIASKIFPQFVFSSDALCLGFWDGTTIHTEGYFKITDNILIANSSKEELEYFINKPYEKDNE